MQFIQVRKMVGFVCVLHQRVGHQGQLMKLEVAGLVLQLWDSSSWDHWDDLEYHERAVRGGAQRQLLWGHHCHVLCVR